MYKRGEGVRQDNGEAAKWYLRAAEQGFADAQNNLGIITAKGQGVPQDTVIAYMWFKLAAAANNETARKNRDILAKRMTADQIVEAQRRASEWMAINQR